MRRSRSTWIVLAAIFLAAFNYFGWTYSKIRAADPLVLMTIELSGELNGIESRLTVFELKRKIKSGESDGATILLDVLTVGSGISPSAGERARVLADDLLTSVVEINGYGSFGYTPLHMAIAGNDADAVEFLLARGADPAVRTRSETTTDEGLDAQEFLRMVEGAIPGKDRSKVANALQNDT